MMRMERDSGDNHELPRWDEYPDVQVEVPLEPTEEKPPPNGTVEEVLHRREVKRWLNILRNGGSN
jgi:hypothetical protein